MAVADYKTHYKLPWFRKLKLEEIVPEYDEDKEKEAASDYLHIYFDYFIIIIYYVLYINEILTSSFYFQKQ